VGFYLVVILRGARMRAESREAAGFVQND